jgi:hypothetical protein
MGLTVHLVRLRLQAPTYVGLQPLRVRLIADPPNGRAAVYIDSRPIPWDRLASQLRIELKQRPPNWPVYLEGDPEMNFGDAVAAIDIIRGLHAEVVLLGPLLN